MYKCNNCGYESTKYFGLCPKCKEGMGEEIPDSYSSSNPSSGKNQENNYRELIGTVDTDVLDDISPLREEDCGEIEAVRTTQFPSFNAILSSAHGFVSSQMCIIGAAPGTGKSTLMTEIASSDTLYISTEESRKQVGIRVQRVNPGCQMDLLCTTSFDKICDAIRKTDKKLIIIDSLNDIEPGSSLQVQSKFASRITNLIKEYDRVCLMICQVARNGEITGMNTLIHVVDTVLHLEKSEISKNVIATSSKNRFGEVGAVAVFKHGEHGLEETSIDYMEITNEVGSTYTETLFGHKNLTICIESLVAQSQSVYGLRNANGYNRNRLIQLIGVLSYFGKLELNNKDIYIAISNGLTTDDVGIELAIANSILSSYFNQSIISKAYGNIKLNGRVSDGYIVKSKYSEPIEINHIRELINLYKEENKNNDPFNVNIEDTVVP